MPITNMRTSIEGKEMTTLLASLFKSSLAFTLVLKVTADFKTFSTPASLHVILGISLLEDVNSLLIDDMFPVLNLDCAMECSIGRVILKHVEP